MKSDVLVVGSTQFVGSNLCNYMLQHTRLTITGIDDLVQGFIGNLQPSLSSKSRFSFYPINLADMVLSDKVITMISPQYVIIDLTNQCVVADIAHLLEITANIGAEKCIILLPSSLDDGNRFITQYYLLAALLQNKSYKYNNMEIIALTPCELYGPRQSINGKFASLAMMTLLNNAGIWRTQPSQWLYIKDLFHNVLKIMEPKTLAPGAYNLTSDLECSDADILSFMQSLMNSEKIALAVTKNAAILAPNTINAISNFDLESSIEHTLCWYADNKWAWR